MPQTLYTSPSGTIQAFAQDGPLLAWFTPSTKGCNAVWVLSLDNGGRVRLPDETSIVAQRDLPLGRRRRPCDLALAGPNALWTLREKQATLPFDYVLGAGVSDTRERRFQEVAHAKRGPGSGSAASRATASARGRAAVSTLVYGTAAVRVRRRDRHASRAARAR